MKLKLSHSEFMALFQLFLVYVKPARPTDLEGKLLHSVLMEVYLKLYKKNAECKPKYSITLEDHEAIAFWFFFTRCPIDGKMVFERNLVRQMNLSIHQKFTS